MTRRRQIGGMQEVFIQLSAASIKDTELAVKAVKKAGGRVLYAVPPRVVVASLPEIAVKELAGSHGIVLATPDPIARRARGEAADPIGRAQRAWNEHLSLDRRLRAMDSAETSRAWDDAGRKPPHPPEDVMRLLRERERELTPAARAGAPLLDIPVLIGRIGVGVIFVDSTEPAFQITDEEETKVISEVTEGLTMLSGFEPRAGIEWFFDFKRPQLSLPLADFPGDNPNGWEDTWRNAAMEAIGHTASLRGMNDYIDSIKNQFNAEWAYAIFVTKYPKTWFAYHWGNHLVLDFQMDVWGMDNFNLVVAHETAHIFGCPDEYASSNCDGAGLFGRYQVPNGNCENGAPHSVACLMKANTPSVCDYTRGHLGWNDLAVLRKGSVNLKRMRTFDFETGVLEPEGGADVWWEHVDAVTRLLVPQNGAMLANLGTVDFDVVSHQTLLSLSYAAAPINGSDNASNALTPGTVIAIRTGSGRLAKMRINTYGLNLRVDYVTYQ